MSAEVLRRAAALMRERAEAATDSTWSTLGERADGGAYIDSEAAPLWVGHVSAYRDAEHIASWHPDVALTAADWLDAEAGRVAEVEDLLGPASRVYPALAFARAYLGEALC